MRITFNIDDDLLGEAQRLTGLTERTAVIHEGLRALIERESARRLARLGATERSLRVSAATAGGGREAQVILVDTSSGSSISAGEAWRWPASSRPPGVDSPLRDRRACGTLSNRREVLGLLTRLPSAPTATSTEPLDFLEEWGLMGRGIGFIDVHLLASAMLAAPARLWTSDRRLAAIASELNDVAYESARR